MHAEKQFRPPSGWLMLAVSLAVLAAGVFLLVQIVQQANHVGSGGGSPKLWIIGLAACAVAEVLLLVGFFTLQPNEAAVLLLFGRYVGTARESGFHWTNPFYTRQRVSLRLRNLQGDSLKVNDKQGNPIEIGAVVVWRVENTAQALFDVENYSQFVLVQSETAVRHLANTYAYDYGEAHEITLRSGVDEVSAALTQELQRRLDRAGVQVEEARLTHLAYAPEIAGAMLRRQQAEAIIAARQKIVQGAVSMVQMALDELAARQVIELTDERKAAMVSSLLLVLCGETDVQPVIGAGNVSP